MILADTAELLLSDSERLAAAAVGAGVDVALDAGEGLPQVYRSMAGTPEAARATEEIGDVPARTGALTRPLPVLGVSP